MIATDADGIEAGHVLRRVGEDVADDAHGRRGRIDERVPHHELFEDVVLDGPGQQVLAHPLLLGCDDVERQNRQHRAVHGHADAHLVQRNAFEEAFHVLDAVDGHTRLAHVPLDTRMVAVVATVRGQIKRHTQPLLACRQVSAVKGVAFLGRGKPCVLAHGPGAHGVHRGIRPPEVRRHAWSKLFMGVPLTLYLMLAGQVLRPGIGLEGCAVGRLCGMVQRVETRFRVLRPSRRASIHVGRHVPGAGQVGTLALQRPLAHEVVAGAPTASGFKRFKTRPRLFGHLPGQGLHSVAAFHGVGMGAQPSLFPQHMLDVSGPTQRPGVFLALGIKPVMRSEIVGTDFQPVHPTHHSRVRRDGVGQQRIASAFGMQPEGGGLGLQSQRTGVRTSHLREQAVPHGPRRAGHRHAGQHVGTHGHPHGGMLGGRFQPPASIKQNSQPCFGRAHHGAQGVHRQHATVLPFGGVHPPNLEGRHGRMPGFGVKRQGFFVKGTRPAHIPRAGPLHIHAIGPRHHGTQGADGVVSVHVQRHHLWVHLLEQIPQLGTVDALGGGADALHAMHQALHQGFMGAEPLLDFPPCLRAWEGQRRQWIHHHLGNGQPIPPHLARHILLSPGATQPSFGCPRRKLLSVHAFEIKVIRFAA